MAGTDAQDSTTRSSDGRITYRRLRAPAGDGEVLCEPPLKESIAAIDANVRNLAGWNFSVDNCDVQALCRAARAEACAAAVRFTSQYDDIDGTLINPERIYVVGHQPDLFHPGVWLKNFCLDQMAKRDGATALHVLVDNDVVGKVALQVPAGGLESPQLREVDLDQAAAPIPWEQRQLLDAQHFLRAGDAIAEQIRAFVDAPLATQLWQFADEQNVQGANLGQLLARMRHRLERSWGLKTLEVPLSELCCSETFHWFVAVLIARLPQVHGSCNRALAEYRRLHRLRSPSHPMPDLKSDGERFEAPFWVWNAQDPQRRALYVEQVRDHWRLSDDAGWAHRLPADHGDLSELAQGLSDLENAGIKIRPRALTTTMYLRLFLSDYFIHGIGGAKYDQITDCVIEDIFGLKPPAFMIASGTRLLPIDLPDSDGHSVADFDRLLRDWDFHPEKVLPDDLAPEQKEQAAELIDAKRSLTSGGAGLGGRERHAEITRLNEELRKLAPNRRDELFSQRQQAEAQQHAREILTARDFSLCLYPESSLRPWLLGAPDRTT